MCAPKNAGLTEQFFLSRIELHYGKEVVDIFSYTFFLFR